MVGVGRTEEHEALALRVAQHGTVGGRYSSGTGTVEWPSGTAVKVHAGALERRRRTRSRESAAVGCAQPLAGVERRLEPLTRGFWGLKRCCRRCSFRYMQPKKGGGRPWKGAPGANSANSAPR